MVLPEWLVERFPAATVLEQRWGAVSGFAAAAWLVFYGGLLLSAAIHHSLLRWFDLVFIPIHEGGHLLLRFFGEWLSAAGGTGLQLFAPLALAAYFAFRRELAGTTFCIFFFFSQFLPIGVYMADARSQSLEYVTVGDPELAEHDWFYLFSRVGVLEYDTSIGGAVRVLGWLGMIATVAWFGWRCFGRRTPADQR